LSEVELRNELPNETHVNLKKIYSSGTTLLGIVNDILDMSKIESGKFELVPVRYDFANLVSDTIHMNVVRIASKPIDFGTVVDPDTPVKLFGDEIRLKQILTNLLSNAFKYTLEGTVTLTILCQRRGDQALLTFTVSDTGIGIKKEDIETIFAEYNQLDRGANRKIEGTGLGLSICKNLVELMGGTIEVESEYGKGSIFTVRIAQQIMEPDPIGIEVSQNLKTYRIDENHQAKALVHTPMPYGKILVVDDVQTNLDVAHALMEPYGLTIHCLSSGRQTLDAIREAKVLYDVIFMDHMMPELDGIETVRLIREEISTEYARNVPIVALTANALVGNEEMFLSHGFQDFISKPIDVMRLDELLHKWIRDKHPLDAVQTLESSGSPAVPRVAWRVEGLDVNAGVLTFGSEAAYLQILETYWEHTPALLEKIGNVDEKSLKEYSVTVHGIKGSSLGIRADKVGKMAEFLENAAKRGDYVTISRHNNEFVQVAGKLISDIGFLLEEKRFSREKAETRDSPDPRLLNDMLRHCRRYDVAQMEKTMDELERFTYRSHGELVKWLRKKTEELEYQQIEDRLRSAAGWHSFLD
jgi:CheY-like chemotaxis protein/anti-sigma regulatory factor (Ser/Thr protein kinase)